MAVSTRLGLLKPWMSMDVHVLLDGSVEIFNKTDRIARFDSKSAHTIGLY
jgi:hypothetical protein